MSKRLQLQTQMKSTFISSMPMPMPMPMPMHSKLLQRKCACNGSAGLTGEYSNCRKKKLTIQRVTIASHGKKYEGEEQVPPIVYEVLRSPGQPLKPATRTFRESHFGHDFSKVRVHTDRKAAESAQAVNALAYTVGRNLVFGVGQYVPHSQEGKRLLAHELTHAVQQSKSETFPSQLLAQPAYDAYEQEADQVASQVAHGSAINSETPVVHEMVHGRGIQRYELGEGTGPDFGGGIRYVPVPDDERARVEAALAIVSRVVSNPRDFPGCPRFFRDNCPGDSETALYDAFNRAVIWREVGSPEGDLGSAAGVGGENIAYTALSYRIGRWAMAASFFHELMHVCGQASHDVGDQAKNVCGRLPNIIAIRPQIRISNPIHP